MPPWRPKISIFYTPNWTGYLEHIIFWYYISCWANFIVFMNKFKKPNLIHPETHTHKQGKCYIKHQNVMETTELTACHQEKVCGKFDNFMQPETATLFDFEWTGLINVREGDRSLTWIVNMAKVHKLFGSLKFANFFPNEIDEKSLPIFFHITKFSKTKVGHQWQWILKVKTPPSSRRLRLSHEMIVSKKEFFFSDIMKQDSLHFPYIASSKTYK